MYWVARIATVQASFINWDEMGLSQITSQRQWANQKNKNLRFWLNLYGESGCTDSLRKSSVACDCLLGSRFRPQGAFLDCKKSKTLSSGMYLALIQVRW